MHGGVRPAGAPPPRTPERHDNDLAEVEGHEYDDIPNEVELEKAHVQTLSVDEVRNGGISTQINKDCVDCVDDQVRAPESDCMSSRKC